MYGHTAEDALRSIYGHACATLEWATPAELEVEMKGGCLAYRAFTQRVQVANIEGLWSQKPMRVWFWGFLALNIGYLDSCVGLVA